MRESEDRRRDGIASNALTKQITSVYQQRD